MMWREHKRWLVDGGSSWMSAREEQNDEMEQSRTSIGHNGEAADVVRLAVPVSLGVGVPHSLGLVG